MAKAVDLLEERYRAYPQSMSARAQYASGAAALQPAQGCAGDAASDGSGARHRLGGVYGGWCGRGTGGIWLPASTCWANIDAELAITARWRDSASRVWQIMRGRALGALGREREVIELLRQAWQEPRSTRSPSASWRSPPSSWLHGHRAGCSGPGRECPREARARAAHQFQTGRGHRLGEPTARSEGARAGGARVGRAGCTPTRSRSWRRRPGSPFCSPTRLPPSGSTASSPGRATCP